MADELNELLGRAKTLGDTARAHEVKALELKKKKRPSFGQVLKKVLAKVLVFLGFAGATVVMGAGMVAWALVKLCLLVALAVMIISFAILFFKATFMFWFILIAAAIWTLYDILVFLSGRRS